jgi:3-deoxy-manno-octulosonate cytidylyltransferase (CMP-KDO synthetase)
MSKPRNPIVLIPARLASQRLPDKPLADIAGEPMIVHVWRRAIEAGIGPVVVACADQLIADVIESAGGKAVMTRPDHPSGSDRIYEALMLIDPDNNYDAVVNVQGDLPTIDPAVIGTVLDPLQIQEVQMATLAAEITDPAEREDPNVVKAVVDLAPGARIGRALYFSRAAIPTGDGPLLHHIGLYAFRRDALAQFVALPESPLEQREKLEQLRALAAGMRIDVALVDTVPDGVDTPADLEKARARLAQKA